MSAAALPPLSPLGTARQALGEGPALPAGLAELLAAGDLDESRAFLAWQLAELPRGLDAAEREALALLVGRLLVAEAAGSTRLAIDAKEREQLCRAHGLVAEAAARARAPLLLDGGFLYTERAHACEERVAAALSARLSPGPFAPAAIARAVADAAARGEPAPTSEQTAAVAAALDRRLGVISGGPGTGKTTTALLLAQSLARLGVPPAAIALAAPTGKAKSRLEEAFRARLSGLVEPSPIDRELGQGCPAAQTLHRLLGIGPGLDSRRAAGSAPLPFRAVVVDESSMIDLVLMDRLLAGLPAQSQLVLLGDADQLPSVSTGAVFRDLGRVATRLGRGFRADPEKPTGRRLAALAQAVRLGDTRTSAGLCVPRGAPGELTWQGIELLSPAHRDELLRKHHGRLAHAVAGAGGAGHVFTLRDGRFAEADAPRLDALAASLGQTRVLCVTRQGPSGVERTNAFLHGLAGDGPDFLPGEPVLMLRNDYERELWNGEQGIALRGREVGGPVATVVAFRARGGWLAVHPHLLGGALGLGYALTVHKAQGSEYDEVLLLLPDYPCPLSSRELLYTAISRARESVVLCGSLELFKCGVATAEQRSSGLAERLAARPGAP
ncbi:MAG: AAA family ATPase [Deltaproteobacteria bacterium]|nr:AAA family ATPase [Deltaproteobacteria bacterium]